MIITLMGANFGSNNINGTRYTITFVYVDESGVTLGSIQRQRSAGYSVTFRSDNVPEFSGYTFKSANPASISDLSKDEQVTITCAKSESTNPPSGGDRTYTIGETLKFNDMSEVASTFISESYYKATDSGNPGSKLTVETRSGYKAWKNIRVYAGQSYALNPDARAICLYDADENAWAGFNLKNTYTDGIIPAEVVTQDGWMSVTVTTSVADDNCTIRRVS